MKIVLATGIYPPDIGGPATYVENLAREFSAGGDAVTVVTYGSTKDEGSSAKGWNVLHVSKDGGPINRWKRYADVLTEHASDADVIIAFSSVSAGVPLMMARLAKPRKILRLGGDFFWERYTDRGGMKTLREWHASWRSWLWRKIMRRILGSFDHVVYSTQFQCDIHRGAYSLPSVSVLRNTSAVAHAPKTAHQPHEPFRLLFVGRFVGFKNLLSLVRALSQLSDCCLTLVGDGPMRPALEKLSRKLRFGDRISICPPVEGDQKRTVFDGHDLLVIPSLTEISPHVAIEAAAAGLPVLLTKETGLAADEAEGMMLARLRTPDDIVKAVGVAGRFNANPGSAAAQRGWPAVAADWKTLFRTLHV